MEFLTEELGECVIHIVFGIAFIRAIAAFLNMVSAF